MEKLKLEICFLIVLGILILPLGVAQAEIFGCYQKKSRTATNCK